MSNPKQLLNNNERYYGDLKIGPGIMFYNALCKLKHSISKYQLRIPTTYHIEMEMLLCFDLKCDFIIESKPISIPKYKQILSIEARKYIERYKQDEEMLNNPMVIIRNKQYFNSYELGTVIFII